MELYLRWLATHDQEHGEKLPLGCMLKNASLELDSMRYKARESSVNRGGEIKVGIIPTR